MSLPSQDDAFKDEDDQLLLNACLKFESSDPEIVDVNAKNWKKFDNETCPKDGGNMGSQQDVATKSLFEFVEDQDQEILSISSQVEDLQLQNPAASTSFAMTVQAPSTVSIDSVDVKDAATKMFPEKRKADDVDRDMDKSKLLKLSYSQPFSLGRKLVHDIIIFSSAHNNARETSELCPKLNADFVSSLNEHVTHFICRYHSQVGVVKEVNLYKALVMGIWVLLPSWLETAFASGRFPDEEQYTLDQTEICKRKRLGKVGPFSRNDPLFEGILFIISDQWPCEDYKFKNAELRQIIAAGGGRLKNTTRLEDKDLKGIKATYLVTTDVSGPKRATRVTELYSELGILTVHPKFVINAIWSNTLDNVPVDLLFTPRLLLNKLD